MQSYLQSGRFVDSDHPVVVEFAEKSRGNSAKPRDQAVALYYAVRDGVRYNPYVFSRDPQTLKASHALQQGESYCVPKAILLAACARHCRIPARIGLADVRNHLATPRLLEALRSEVFAMHGYTELYLLSLIHIYLLWFFGGDCLHFMPDEEIDRFQSNVSPRSSAS